TITARELKFDEVPNATVEFTGQPRRTTVWDAARHNLPRPVQPGVTYRDIGIQLVITSVFADIDRIVAEALGEVPRTDDTPTTVTTTPPPDNAPPPPQSARTKDPVPAQAALAQTAVPPRATAAIHNTSPARNAHGRRVGRPR
ncbi:MAG TPA: hypothetical protein VE775_00095, partial [Pyrinomonadaceae bacterium]|nr:hypothetical protein [Pyrinomonadaceae bacterium]